MPSRSLIVTAFVRSTFVRYVRRSFDVRARFDSFPGSTFVAMSISARARDHAHAFAQLPSTRARTPHTHAPRGCSTRTRAFVPSRSRARSATYLRSASFPVTATAVHVCEFVAGVARARAPARRAVPRAFDPCLRALRRSAVLPRRAAAVHAAVPAACRHVRAPAAQVPFCRVRPPFAVP